ncbi:MAG: hypothetical protein ACYCPN_04370 [Thermoplasmata archaeon]
MQTADEQSPTMQPRGLGQRGISTTMAAVVMIVVIVVVGGIGYVGIGALAGQGSNTVSSCQPATSPVCHSTSNLNNVVLFVAYQPGYGQSMIQLQEGQSLPATVSLSGGGVASSYTVHWGDGTTTTQTAPTFTHTYTSLGVYLMHATANVSGITHQGTRYLYPVEIVPSLANTASGQYPVLATTFTNGSVGAPVSRPWIQVGQGPISVSGSYSSLPTAPGYVAGTPSITSTGGTQLSQNATSTQARATYSFSTAGVYRITFVGPIATPTNSTIYQNYTWTVYVGAPGSSLGCTYCQGKQAVSPHPGTINAYEIAPGGATSLDPAVDYETVGGEVLNNVFETLVNYNGSSTAGFVPVLATCVPGTQACANQYGGNNLLGLVNNKPVYWTFVISGNASFYDPATHHSWGVYPSDVMFSITRTLLWLETPSQYVYNGWIIGQSLLPYGNASWDGGVHTPWNNTPQNILGSMLVNDTQYCPASAMTGAHGCITFKADGSSSVWPFFLQLVGDANGGAIVPCGWYTAQGASVPGFNGTSAPSGDGPCLLPGGAHSTNSSKFQTYLKTVSPMAYDNVIALGASSPYAPQPSVRWNPVGSGPYYLQSVDQGEGYILQANPAYAQPNCAGQPNCYPAPGKYVAHVNVAWEPTSTGGIEQYIAGQADVAGFYPTDIPTILNLVQQGKVGLMTVPTLETFEMGYFYHFDPKATAQQSGLPVNIPGNFFSYVGLREFLSQAFPYAYSLNSLDTVDGIVLDLNFGGAIPQFMGNYYPTNISWPGLNVTTNTWHDPSFNPNVNGSAAYWWKVITTPGNPYYDPQLAGCTKSTPCTFPMVGEQGAQTLALALQAWNAEIVKLTGGAISPSVWQPTFTQIVIALTAAPGTSSFTTAVDGWLPDYPDPTDYMAAYYYPDGSYTYSAALYETFVAEQFGGSYNCPLHSSFTFANLVYWANNGLVPNNCQGTAYSVMTWANLAAASMPVGPQRVLYYNLVEHVANNLALYMYYQQPIGVGSYASWVNPSSIDVNPVSPGQLWFMWTGNGMV